MKHKQKGRSLGREVNNRKRLWKNMTSSLLEHGAITTTEAKAKELRRVVEPLITKTIGEKLSIANRRHLLANLRHPDDLIKLTEVAEASSKRTGGYLRLVRIASNRSDGAKMMKVEIIDK